MPVVFNEPLSFLQRLCEYMEYTSLIKKACMTSDPIDRIQVRNISVLLLLFDLPIPSLFHYIHICIIYFNYLQTVAAFAVSALASQLGRVGKPYNPLLGETYEYHRYV